MGDILKPSGTVRFINGSVYARVYVDPRVVDSSRGLVSTRAHVLFCRACVCFGNGVTRALELNPTGNVQSFTIDLTFRYALFSNFEHAWLLL